MCYTPNCIRNDPAENRVLRARLLELSHHATGFATLEKLVTITDKFRRTDLAERRIQKEARKESP